MEEGEVEELEKKQQGHSKGKGDREEGERGKSKEEKRKSGDRNSIPGKSPIRFQLLK